MTQKIPPAARQLINEVEAHDPEVEWAPAGKPDGLGVYRTIAFDPKAAKWLEDVLEAVRDPRITSTLIKSRKLHVTFVSTTKADFVQGFGVAGAVAVLKDEK